MATLSTNISFSPIPSAWHIFILHKGFLGKCRLVIIFFFFVTCKLLHPCHMLSQNYCIQLHAVLVLLYPCHMLSQNYCIHVTCCPKTTVSSHMLSQNYCIQPHAVPELLYPCHRSISLISIPHSSWFNSGIRYSLWESRKLNSCNLCIHKLSDIWQLWHALKLIHSQTTDMWLWWKLYCCEM
jgi:hypothetical protein